LYDVVQVEVLLDHQLSPVHPLVVELAPPDHGADRERPVRLGRDSATLALDLRLGEATPRLDVDATALDHDGQLTVNIAGEETVSMLDLAMRIAALVGRAPHISHTDMQREDILGDITRMRQTLGAPTVRLADGLADVVR